MSGTRLVIGTEESVAAYAEAHKDDKRPYLTVVNPRQLEEARIALRHSGIQPTVCLLPGWAKSNLLNETVLWLLAAIDQSQ
jgi:hypothetical protein